MEIPEFNNVYGLILCDGRVHELAQLLRIFLDVGECEVRVKTSQFDGEETLRVSTETADFDLYLADADRKFLFNGAVAGDTEQVCDFIIRLYAALQDGGFQASLEVYDDNNNCIAEFHAQLVRQVRQAPSQ
jgi:hypothetical protein